MGTSTNKRRFVLIAGLKWGLSVWAALMLTNVTYEYLFGNVSITADSLGYAIFVLLVCFGWACLLGLRTWERGVRKD
jgi:hypothetical protein